MLETVQGELIYIWYYFDIQLRQILAYWILGTVGIFLASALIRLLSCYVCGVVAGPLVGIRNEYGECGGIYGDRTAYKDLESGCVKDCAGNQKFCSLLFF